MFGTSRNGNNIKLVIANFFIVFLAQLVYTAYELLSTETFPTTFEVYKAVIVALVATLGFYGINKITHKET